MPEYTLPKQMSHALTEHGYEVVAIVMPFAETQQNMLAVAADLEAAGDTEGAAVARGHAEHLDGDEGPRLVSIRRTDYSTGMDGANVVDRVREEVCPWVVFEVLPSDADVPLQTVPYMVGDEVLGS